MHRVAVIGPVAAVAVLLGGGTAFAGTPDPVPICTPAGCVAHTIAPAPLFAPSGALRTILPTGTAVEVTCWYPGNPPPPWRTDGIEDHVVLPSVGHIPDPYLTFGGPIGLKPPPGLPRCR